MLKKQYLCSEFAIYNRQVINSKMDVNILNIRKYLEKITGTQVSIVPIEKAVVHTLPIFITEAYRLLHCEMLETDICLMVS